MISEFFVIRMYILESLNLRLSYGCLRMCFYTFCQHFANMMSPAQMTMPARTVSKFCARTRSECPDIFFLDLISWCISGIIEPWSECLPERIEAFRKTSSKVGLPIALFAMCDTFADFVNHHRPCVEGPCVNTWPTSRRKFNHHRLCVPIMCDSLIIFFNTHQFCSCVSREQLPPHTSSPNHLSQEISNKINLILVFDISYLMSEI